LVRPAVFVALATSAWLAACTSHPGATRELIIIARGMSFVTVDQPDTANPTLTFRAGERVRLILQNEAPGLLHDFAIPDWQVEIPQIRAGESREVAFTVPDTPGRFEYLCRPHSEMMTGTVEVTR
jgi:plastocyanin